MEEGAFIEQEPVDDWVDQDLLTKQDARNRLIDEIGRARAVLEQLHSKGTDAEPDIMLLTRRVNAMESILAEYDAYLQEK